MLWFLVTIMNAVLFNFLQSNLELYQIIINIPSAASRLAGNVRTNKAHILNDQKKMWDCYISFRWIAT